MPKFRVESSESTTITRETWIVAATEADAQLAAESQDWREWSEVTRDTSAHIEFIEEVEE